MFGLTPYESKRNQITINKPRDIFDYFFGDDFYPALPTGFNANFTADIRDLGKEYVIEAEMPGLDKDDIKLDLDGDVLTISAEKKEATSEERGSFIRRERRFGSFTRCFRFEDVQKDGISAKFENGVLNVKLPKLDSAIVHKRAIDIN